MRRGDDADGGKGQANGYEQAEPAGGGNVALVAGLAELFSGLERDRE